MIAPGFEPGTYSLEVSCSIQLSYATYFIFVGVAGFEPAASCSQSRRDNRATLHPEKKAERQGLEPWRQLPVDRLAICSVTTPAPLLLILQRTILFCGCKYKITFYYFQLKKCNIFNLKTNALNINIIQK